MKKILSAVFIWPWRALTWLRGTLANLLLLMLVVLVTSGLLHGGSKVVLEENTLLYVQPGRMIVEQRSYDDSFSSLMQPTDEEIAEESVLHEMTSAIRWAQHDKHIKGIVIQADDLEGADLSKLNALTQAILAFKDSKKPVIALGDNFSQGQYYLASVADKIYLNPMGSVQLHGFGAYQNYLKDLLDTLAINVHVFRVGQFKSFVEPFVRNDMSPEARENLAQWMDEQWSFYRSHIEQRRKLPAGGVDNFINQQDTLLAQNQNNAAKLAQQYGLVDALATRQEAEKVVNTLAGSDEPNTIDTTAYFQLSMERKEPSRLLEKARHIAVIQASGDGTTTAPNTPAATPER